MHARATLTLLLPTLRPLQRREGDSDLGVRWERLGGLGCQWAREWAAENLPWGGEGWGEAASCISEALEHAPISPQTARTRR